jgi:hypothetical protein
LKEDETGISRPEGKESLEDKNANQKEESIIKWEYDEYFNITPRI